MRVRTHCTRGIHHVYKPGISSCYPSALSPSSWIPSISPMPLERSDAILDLSDPNIALGLHKRRPTERLLENGDPLACKKGRRAQASTGVMVSDGSVDKDKLKPSLISPLMPLSSQLTGPTDSAEDSNDAVIVVDDSNEEGSEMEVTDKDNDAKLSMCLTTLDYIHQLISELARL
jgi:hypothetical protein